MKKIPYTLAQSTRYDRLAGAGRAMMRLRKVMLADYYQCVQLIANKYGVTLATGNVSNEWQIVRTGAQGNLIAADDAHPAFDELVVLGRVLQAAGINVPSNRCWFEPKGGRRVRSNNAD